jgi:hypothetical protein
MKKRFGIILVLLIILAGVVFFFGWVQLKTPAGSYGVIRSKLFGVDSRLIKDGEFRWVWYALVPANVKVENYTLKKEVKDFDFSGSLASGDVYAAISGVKADFSWEMSGTIVFSLKPQALVTLSEKEIIGRQEALDTFIARRGEELAYFLKGKIESLSPDDFAGVVGVISPPILVEALSEAYPDMDFDSVLVKTAHIPDFALYNSLKAVYDDYLAAQKNLLSGENAGSAERQMAMQLRLEELKKYGELLEKYPKLLQFLAIEKNGGQITPEVFSD